MMKCDRVGDVWNPDWVFAIWSSSAWIVNNCLFRALLRYIVHFYSSITLYEMNNGVC